MREGWEIRPLGDLADLKIGRTPSRKNPAYWTSDLHYPFCSVTDLGVSREVIPIREGVTQKALDDKKAVLAPAGTLLMSFKLTLGRTAVAGKDLYHNEAIVQLHPKKDELSQEYLELALQGVNWDSLSSPAAKGKTLNSKSLKAAPIIYAPPHEQRRIVDVMASMDMAIEAAQTEFDVALKAYRQTLRSLLLPAEADNWPVRSLGDVVTLHYGKALPARSRSGSGYDVFGSNGVVGQHDKALASGPSTIIGRKGAYAGSVHWAREDFWVIDTAFYTSINDPTQVSMEFMYLVLLDATLSRYQTQTGIPGVSRDNLYMHRFPLPSTEEQQQIVDTMGSIDTTVKACEKSLADLREARSQVLTTLLSGEHEIPESYDDYMAARDGVLVAS